MGLIRLSLPMASSSSSDDSPHQKFADAPHVIHDYVYIHPGLQTQREESEKQAEALHTLVLLVASVPTFNLISSIIALL